MFVTGDDGGGGGGHSDFAAPHVADVRPVVWRRMLLSE